MKKTLLSAFLVIVFYAPVYSSVTTADGFITLDYYEDTQSGIENRWVLDFKVNELSGTQYTSVLFDMRFLNTAMDFDNIYNQNNDFYTFGHEDHFTYEYPVISSHGVKLIPTYAGTNYLFYSLPEQQKELIIGNFSIDIYYIDALGNTNSELLRLSGPVGFTPVPEPVSMALFVFGIIVCYSKAK
ncbi:MAG: hypothetical protein AB1454_14375 [Candidatus Auribacterota bacterium]